MSAAKKKKSNKKKNSKKNTKKVTTVNNQKNTKQESSKNDSQNSINNAQENKLNEQNIKNDEKTNKTSKNSKSKNKTSDENVKIKEENKSAKSASKNEKQNDKTTKAENKKQKNVKSKDQKQEAKKTKTENLNKKEEIKNVDEKPKSKKTKAKDKEKVKEEKVEKIEKAESVEKDSKQNIKNKKDKENIEDDTKKESKEKSNKDVKEQSPESVTNTKKKIYIFVCIVVLILIMILFSTCFALLNLNNQNVVKGVSIKNIDISDLSKEDARNRINEAINVELMAEMDLQYGNDYKVTLKPEQIEFNYKIDEAIETAFDVGRGGNIIINNYSLIFASFFGKNVKLEYTYNEELLDQFIDDVASKIPGVVINPTYYIEENKLFVSPGTDGIQIKKDDLKEEILNGIISRKTEEMMEDGYSQTIEIPIEEVKAESIDMEKIYSKIHTEPKDAYFETDPYKIYPDVDGVDLAISVEEAQNIVNAETKEEYSFDLIITKAEKTIDDLGTEAFPYLISSFSTNYVASNVNRTTNLRIAAEKINGKVLMPGEEFSFNQVVGKRTVEEGYKDAQIYADGGVVDGLAGGICQISSTLYNAVLLANLQITERRNHTYTTSYLEAGKDATVVWGTIDFKFVNSRSYPIKIESSVDGGVATFKIHGIQEETEYEVRISPVRTQSIPYSTSYVEDPTLAPGAQVVSQAGHAGYKVTTYKEVILDGNVISKEVISNDTYSPMRAIIRIGIGTPIDPNAGQ